MRLESDLEPGRVTSPFIFLIGGRGRGGERADNEVGDFDWGVRNAGLEG